MIPDMRKVDSTGAHRWGSPDSTGDLHAMPAFGHWITIVNYYRLSCIRCTYRISYIRHMLAVSSHAKRGLFLYREQCSNGRRRVEMDKRNLALLERGVKPNAAPKDVQQVMTIWTNGSVNPNGDRPAEPPGMNDCNYNHRLSNHDEVSNHRSLLVAFTLQHTRASRTRGSCQLIIER